ncbi:hypothetical protein B5C34_08265 [Pacificimonas flava]|uniref:YrhK domain-containing protein n=2 Tax=Pacificimonas TaxID=1960290 RepID=A0A219B5R0_9SPHN|nr:MULTISPECIES: YrhK family protein [Pacificimonas]MBZ6379344.1 YrhK family protein [Pacificimonas aurantium]OWV33456.1 hypothetical protein B5C34_08265 [Pacificimonas flava]
MRNLLKTVVEDYGWIHTGLGLLGNVMFFVGSILFLPQFEQWKTTGIWLFIVGSFLMLVGALGEFVVNLRRRGRNDG